MITPAQFDEPIAIDTPEGIAHAKKEAEKAGYPIVVKAVGGGGVAILVLLTLLAWLLSGFYTVGPNEIGLNLIFGKYRGKTQAGLNYNLPGPVGAQAHTARFFYPQWRRQQWAIRLAQLWLWIGRRSPESVPGTAAQRHHADG